MSIRAPEPRLLDATVLIGLRVLIVEDELLVALDAQTIVSALGVVVVGPVPRAPAALAIIREQALDGAMLDLNLGGTISFEVADALAERRIPFIFVTGYGKAALPERFAGRPLIGKPFVREELAPAMVAAFARPAAPH